MFEDVETQVNEHKDEHPGTGLVREVSSESSNQDFDTEEGEGVEKTLSCKDVTSQAM